MPDNSPIKGIKDIKGKRVGVMTSTTGSLIAQDMLGKTSPNIRSYAEMPSMVEDLYNKRVDRFFRGRASPYIYVWG
ncbi:ABC transporter substrate-binding protein [Aneurinibacillus tyrosinisolvens]|uniref:ABC transporter substrate-binding protein n=1 Tax=Aneurinibacillus tyrosinisolvens TaxID=1443435 RepID=UPI00063F28BF|nr:transporter substrate-binding domain-containing protein [Aneurinibacillus tyrosinisolvens]